MKKINGQKFIFYSAITLSGSTFLLAILGSLFYIWGQNRIFQTARTKAQREAVRVTIQIDRELLNAKKTALSLANDLTSGKIPPGEVVNTLKNRIESNPNLFDLGVAYQPFATAANVRLYGPTYARIKTELELIEIQNNYDYTHPKYIWYRNALSIGSHWGEPRFWPNNNLISEPLVGFYTPFYNPQSQSQQAQGVVYSEYSLAKIRDIMKSLNLGKTGYGFIVSPSGTFIYHPNEEYVKGQRNIVEIAYEQNQTPVRDAISKALQGEPVTADLKDEITGESSWLFLRQTHQNGWVVGVVFIQDEVVPDTATTRRQLIAISLAFMWSFVFLFVLIFRADKGTLKRLSLLVVTVSMLFMAQIKFIWDLALRARTYTSTRNVIVSETAVEQLLASQVDLSAKLNQDSPLFVPTGVLIQSLKFSSASDVFITGYIWQEYQTGVHDKLSRGFIFPDAVSANMTEAYRHKEGNVEVIGWYVETTLRQNFDFSDYPLDFKDVKIRLLHQDFNRQELNRRVILVPDLESYQVINPRTKPGVDKDIVLEDWNMTDTFFEYQFKNYTTNFGIKSSTIKSDYPELYFTIIVQRDFLGAFIAKVGPLFVVSTLLYALLLVADKDKVMTILSACGGFVFIVILNQIATRDQIIAKGIIYFEYFYFIVYFYIFLVAMICILFILRPDLAIIKYENNLIPKLVYWPSLLKILMIVTIFVFA